MKKELPSTIILSIHFLKRVFSVTLDDPFPNLVHDRFTTCLLFQVLSRL